MYAGLKLIKKTFMFFAELILRRVSIIKTRRHFAFVDAMENDSKRVMRNYHEKPTIYYVV